MLEASQSVSPVQSAVWFCMTALTVVSGGTAAAVRRQSSSLLWSLSTRNGERRGNNSRITEWVEQLPPGAAVEGRKTASPETKNIS